eukprot:Colp12_sorted_trinity150504_noHs@11727
MAAPSESKLKQHIKEVLRTADLDTVSAKTVRKQLEEKFGVDLTEKKEDIKTWTLEIMDEIEKEREKKDQESSESSEEENDVTKDDEKLARQLQEADGRPRRSTAKKADAKKKPKSKKGKDEGEKKKRASSGGGLQKPLKLSSELAALVGESMMPRTKVIKRLWELIKERDLQDPSDKRWFFARDPDFYNVFKSDRVNAFGMNKTLSKHFYNKDEMIGGDDE